MKEITVIVLCAFKFALTFPLAIYGMKMSFWKTIILTNIGGLAGIISSVNLSKLLIFLWNKYISPLLPVRMRSTSIRHKRRIVHIKAQYGFPGIVILTHVFFSIPVGGFLMTKYFGSGIRNIFWLFTGQLAWSFIFTFFYMFVKDLVI